MKRSGGEIVVEVFENEDVQFIFGIPGTHNIELWDQFHDRERLKPILITDEQCAGFLADGVARSSGQLAALCLVPGAGITHAMSGIAEAYLDQIPVLVLACGVRRDVEFAYQLHDINQVEIVRPVSKQVFQPQTHTELSEMLTRACRLAKASPCGPVVVEVPANLYMKNGVWEAPAPMALPAPRSTVDESMPALLDLIAKSKSIGIYLGLGARDAGHDLVEMAEVLDAVVCTSLSGKGVFPENHPRWLWNGIGRILPAPLHRIEKGVDLWIAIGCRFGEVGTGSYGLGDIHELVHVDVDPTVMGRNVKTSLKIVSDAKEFVQKLLKRPELRQHPREAERLEDLRRAHLEVNELLKAPGDAARVSPDAFFRALQKINGEDTVYVTDSGNGTFLAMEHLRLPKARSFLAPVDYSCMGYSVPAGIGAKLASPSRPVAILAGDGAFLMTGLELTTARTYGVGVMVFLLRDRELSQIAQFQRISLGRETCTEVHDYRASALAEATGLEYLVCREDHQIEEILTKAHHFGKAGLPVLVEVEIDYSRTTFFSKGAVKNHFFRLSFQDKARMVSKILKRKLF